MLQVYSQPPAESIRIWRSNSRWTRRAGPLLENAADVGPDHPMWVQVNGAMAPVERASVLAADVDTDPAGTIFDEPLREQVEQLRRDVGSTVRRHDIDPLELPVAVEPASEMPRRITDLRFTTDGHPHDSGRKCLLWMVFAGQVRRNAANTSSLTHQRQSHQTRHVHEVSLFVKDPGHSSALKVSYPRKK